MIKRKTKASGGKKNFRAIWIGAAGATLAAGLAAAAWFGLGKLKALWNERCIIRDKDAEVVVIAGKMVKTDTAVYCFGLTNGANLAEIPFGKMRADFIARQPQIRDIRIERRQPNRITVEIIEREPVARIAAAGRSARSFRLADAEGMVFTFGGETGPLPLIRESRDAETRPGRKLAGNALAALHLVEFAAMPEFSGLRIYEIDASNPDYLLLRMADSSGVKIAWQAMGEDTRTARESLQRQLTRVAQAINSGIITRPTVWNATDFAADGRIHAIDPSMIQSK